MFFGSIIAFIGNLLGSIIVIIISRYLFKDCLNNYFKNSI